MTDKVVVITGGSRGLGAAMSHHFAAEGDTVVIASRKREACEALAADLRETTGARVEGVGCHVGRWSDCDDLIAGVIERFGRLDVLINNAGMSPLYSTLEDVSEELFDKVIATNLRGPFRLAVRAGELMRRQGGGIIVNISSIAAIRPSALDLPYAAAKAALNAVTIGLAGTLGPTVRINGVLAGPFDTTVTAAWTDETRARTSGERVPLGRIGAAEEIVGTVAYLTSPASSFTTGALITVDGGMTSMSS
jgi:NAD(P)-dependent dehydrogenase (short-subunit alcohol dehydrogenase family)